jgi:hypothetical protein
MLIKQIITVSCLTTLFLSLVHPLVYSQTATSSGISLEDITENVKKRIQEVVKDKILTVSSQESAYLGTLQSLNNHTLSVQTDDGIHQASTSAETVFLKTPNLKPITNNDLAIDSYLVVIGISTSDQVLEATEVISQDSAPIPATDKTFYGLIQNYDPKTFIITAQNPATQELFSALISRKANLNRWVADGTKDTLKRTQALPLGTPTIVVYTPGGAPDDSNLAIDVLLGPAITNPLSPTP